MLGKLTQDGYVLVPEADGADVVVVNTCGFIEPARQESLAVIRDLLALKREGRVGSVVVAGCLAERKQDELLQLLPEVDHVVGVFGREEISQVVERCWPSDTSSAPCFGRRRSALKRTLPASHHTTPLCLPQDFGRLRPAVYVLCHPRHARQARHQTHRRSDPRGTRTGADGVRELILVAQDTTYYGMDLYGRVRLAELLAKLDRLDGLEWIRILYAYPINFTDELIETLVSAGKVIPYLDLPLQHINHRVLRRMQRRIDRAGTEDLLARLRLRSSGPGFADHPHRRFPRRDRCRVRRTAGLCAG